MSMAARARGSGLQLLELGNALGRVLILELIKDRALLVLALDQEHLRVDSPGLDGVRIEAFGNERLGK